MDGKLYLRDRRWPAAAVVGEDDDYTYKDEEVFTDGEKKYYYRGISSIPNIKGQKYLIGKSNHLEEVGDDEHFIYDDVHEEKDYSEDEVPLSLSLHFRIHVDVKGFFWALPPDSGSKYKILINGIRLVVGPVSLNFGDRITVKDGRRVLYHFRFQREAKPCSEVEVVNKEKFRVELMEDKLVTRGSTFTRTKVDWRMNLLRFAKQGKPSFAEISNLEIEFIVPSFTSQAKLNDYLQDFNRYFINLDGFGDSVKSLKIIGDTLSHWEKERDLENKIWTASLKKFKHVEDLTMVIRHDFSWIYPDFPEVQMPNLRCFEISVIGSADGQVMREEDKVKVNLWIKGCVKAITEVRVLNIRHFLFAHLFLEEICSGPTISLPNLSGLIILLDAQILSDVLKMKLTLTLLKLYISNDDDKAIPKAGWQRLLEAQASTLKTLFISFADRIRETPVLKFTMPVAFPNLEDFELNYPEKGLELAWKGYAQFDLIDYAKTFPMLQRLTLSCHTFLWYRGKNALEVCHLWGKYDRMWHLFFGGSTPHPTLRSVEVPHLKMKLPDLTCSPPPKESESTHTNPVEEETSDSSEMDTSDSSDMESDSSEMDTSESSDTESSESLNMELSESRGTESAESAELLIISEFQNAQLLNYFYKMRALAVHFPCAANPYLLDIKDNDMPKDIDKIIERLKCGVLEVPSNFFNW